MTSSLSLEELSPLLFPPSLFVLAIVPTRSLLLAIDEKSLFHQRRQLSNHAMMMMGMIPLQPTIDWQAEHLEKSKYAGRHVAAGVGNYRAYGEDSQG